MKTQTYHIYHRDALWFPFRREITDPLDPAVQAWWDAKVAEIYTYIPDFGGFLVKANSAGQPGPHDYGPDHAEGANMLAVPLAAEGRDGSVMWRACTPSLVARTRTRISWSVAYPRPSAAWMARSVIRSSQAVQVQRR